jgi:hypothetical protein
VSQLVPSGGDLYSYVLFEVSLSMPPAVGEETARCSALRSGAVAASVDTVATALSRLQGSPVPPASVLVVSVKQVGQELRVVYAVLLLDPTAVETATSSGCVWGCAHSAANSRRILLSVPPIVECLRPAGLPVLGKQCMALLTTCNVPDSYGLSGTPLPCPFFVPYSFIGDAGGGLLAALVVAGFDPSGMALSVNTSSTVRLVCPSCVGVGCWFAYVLEVDAVFVVHWLLALSLDLETTPALASLPPLPSLSSTSVPTACRCSR